MLSRSDSMVFTLPANSFYQTQTPQFDFRPIVARNTEPEIFTFERITQQQHPLPGRGAPVRPRKRNTRVMYPSKVRKYLPPPEKSPAKRWLLILCLVVLMQIYTEDESVETTQGEAPAFTDATSYNVLSFQSPEEQAREMMGNCLEDFTQTPHKQLQASSDEKEVENSWFLNTTCPSSRWEEDMTALYQQSRRNGYVVALLYPVYHTLGSEN